MLVRKRDKNATHGALALLCQFRCYCCSWHFILAFWTLLNVWKKEKRKHTARVPFLVYWACLQRFLVHWVCLPCHACWCRSCWPRSSRIVCGYSFCTLQQAETQSQVFWGFFTSTCHNWTVSFKTKWKIAHFTCPCHTVTSPSASMFNDLKLGSVLYTCRLFSLEWTFKQSAVGYVLVGDFTWESCSAFVTVHPSGMTTWRWCRINHIGGGCVLWLGSFTHPDTASLVW